jgi:putative restriction endonuclease
MSAIYVANTDNDWFDFLRANSPFEEVNFWKPSQQLFKAIDEGGLFVFRLKSPRNVIGGYGVLVSSVNVPIRLAWDSLGIANGVSDQEALIRSIRRYREVHTVTPDTLIGCRVLKDPIFFPEEEWFPVPEDWSANIVTGKVYSFESHEGQRLYENLSQRTRQDILFRRDRRDFEGFEAPPQAGYGAPVLVAPRLGQGAFRLKVSDVYKYECAISETKVLPALDAAHIVPFARGGDHSVSNGLLLRKDIHAIFDEGFATIDSEGKFRVSQKVQTVYHNGNEYLRLAGRTIKVPERPAYWPSADRLEWHRNNVFVGD